MILPEVQGQRHGLRTCPVWLSCPGYFHTHCQHFWVLGWVFSQAGFVMSDYDTYRSPYLRSTWKKTSNYFDDFVQTAWPSFQPSSIYFFSLPFFFFSGICPINSFNLNTLMSKLIKLSNWKIYKLCKMLLITSF